MKEEWNQKVSCMAELRGSGRVDWYEQLKKEKVKGKEEMIDDCRWKLRLREMKFIQKNNKQKTQRWCGPYSWPLDEPLDEPIQASDLSVFIHFTCSRRVVTPAHKPKSTCGDLSSPIMNNSVYVFLGISLATSC